MDPSSDKLKRKRVPGPANGPFGIRHIYSCNTRPLEFYERLGAYGDIATFRMFGVRAFFLNSPELISTVLRDTGPRFRKLPRNMKALARGLGRGVLVTDGDEWLADRRLVQPSFNSRAIEKIIADAVPCVEGLVERWSHESQIELFTEMDKLTVDVAARSLLGMELELEVEQISAAARMLADSWAVSLRRVFLLPHWLPLPRQRREAKAIQFLRNAIDRIIRHRRASSVVRSDLLSRLVIAYSHADGDATTNHERLIDQVLTLFLAAYHASTVTLCWTFYLLARYADIHAQVLNEIEAVLGDRTPTLVDLSELPLTENVLKESMRLYPSAWELFPRQAIETTDLGPWRIPRGAWIFLSPYVTHRDERFFANPRMFDPGRWAPGRVEAIDPRAYFPFGGGRHICVGRDMAMAQNMLILVMILRIYRMRTQQIEHVPDRLPPMALVPRDPMWMAVERYPAPVPALIS